MSRHDEPDENETDDLSDRDLPREEDMDADLDEPALDPCPYCKKMIGEDAEWCHHCGNYLSREDEPKHVPLWFIIAAAATALVVMSWVLLGR
jgi:predicted nucleic acid-binding Zn ribbon protein